MKLTMCIGFVILGLINIGIHLFETYHMREPIQTPVSEIVYQNDNIHGRWKYEGSEETGNYNIGTVIITCLKCNKIHKMTRTFDALARAKISCCP